MTTLTTVSTHFFLGGGSKKHKLHQIHVPTHSIFWITKKNPQSTKLSLFYLLHSGIPLHNQLSFLARVSFQFGPLKHTIATCAGPIYIKRDAKTTN